MGVVFGAGFIILIPTYNDLACNKCNNNEVNSYTDGSKKLSETCCLLAGTYQGQWLRGLRHGYGVRTSAPFGMASHFRPKAPTGSMTSLKSENAEPTSER